MRRIILIGVVTCWNGVLWAQAVEPPSVESREELQKRIEQLEKELKLLEEIVEGTAAEVNLGRTSIAAVAASSVNGGRALDDQFYGVLNAFDDGNNLINNINYTSWLGNGGSEWVEIHFDHPVTITSIHVEANPNPLKGFETKLTFDKGGEKSFPDLNRVLELPQKAHGVKRVRVTVPQPAGIPTIQEIRVMGHVPPGVVYRVGKPRLHITGRTGLALAKAEFEKWRLALAVPSTFKTKEDERNVEVTFSANGMDLLKVTIDKATGKVTRDCFVRLAPIERRFP